MKTTSVPRGDQAVPAPVRSENATVVHGKVRRPSPPRPGWVAAFGDIGHADGDGFSFFFGTRSGGGLRRNSNWWSPGFVEKVLAEDPQVADVHHLPSGVGASVVAAIIPWVRPRPPAVPAHSRRPRGQHRSSLPASQSRSNRPMKPQDQFLAKAFTADPASTRRQPINRPTSTHRTSRGSSANNVRLQPFRTWSWSRERIQVVLEAARLASAGQRAEPAHRGRASPRRRPGHLRRATPIAGSSRSRPRPGLDRVVPRRRSRSTADASPAGTAGRQALGFRSTKTTTSIPSSPSSRPMHGRVEEPASARSTITEITRATLMACVASGPIASATPRPRSAGGLGLPDLRVLLLQHRLPGPSP